MSLTMPGWQADRGLGRERDATPAGFHHTAGTGTILLQGRTAANSWKYTSAGRLLGAKTPRGSRKLYGDMFSDNVSAFPALHKAAQIERRFYSIGCPSLNAFNLSARLGSLATLPVVYFLLALWPRLYIKGIVTA